MIERRLAYRLALTGADRTALRDHVQEVLVHLLERDGEALRRWDPARGSLEPYVAKIADNLLISRLRKRPPPSPTAELDREAATSASPEQGAAYAHLVMHLLRDLSEHDAILFRAVYLEELSVVHSVLVDVMSGRCEVSVTIAFRAAKVLDASIYDVIAGKALPADTRRHCGKEASEHWCCAGEAR